MASLACLVHAGSATAQQWEELGPPGGTVYFVAAGPAASGKVYALGGYNGPRMFASADNGASWTERPPPPGCPSPTSLQVRSDGDVFVNGNRVRNLRSHDDARSWSL